MDGEILHRLGTGVPPERWCITPRDLSFFRGELRKSVGAGVIRSSEVDRFDGKAGGPNMYTVVHQCIKPLTAQAGRMSWALLRHPDGLPCSIFITHCWAEGAYEFIEKVLASWPIGPGMRAAWCCIFANPQNLDIASLISEPKNSPFAIALRSATHMMVVPTASCSIYTRIWCVYEAFLASEDAKVIFLARSPLGKGLVVQSILVAALACLLSIVFFEYLPQHAPQASARARRMQRRGFPPYPVVFFAHVGLAIISPTVTRLNRRASALVNALGLVSATWFVLLCIKHKQQYFSIRRFFSDDMVARYIILQCSSWFFWPLSVLDRLRELEALHEATELRGGYAGSANATSSNEDDKRRILCEIGDRLEAVDESIQVLLDAYMSTPALRKAFSAGVNVCQAADLRMGYVFGACLVWVADTDHQACTGLIEGVIIFVIVAAAFISQENDHRHFMVTAGLKLWSMWLVICIIPVGMVNGGLELCVPLRRACFYPFLVVGIIFSLAGRRHLVRLPYVGPWLVQAFGPGCGCRPTGRARLGPPQQAVGTVELMDMYVSGVDSLCEDQQ